jgi:hypothetical protein
MPGKPSSRARPKLERKNELNDGDIANILKEIGDGFGELDAAKKEELKRSLNGISCQWRMLRAWRFKNVSSERIRRARKAQDKLRAAGVAVQALGLELAYAADQIGENHYSKETASLERLRCEHPGLSEPVLVFMQKAGVIVPSEEAKLSVVCDSSPHVEVAEGRGALPLRRRLSCRLPLRSRSDLQRWAQHQLRERSRGQSQR